MTTMPPPDNDNFVSDRDRDGALNDIGTRWRRFNRRGLAALQSNDELVTQVAAKYGMEIATARHEVDALMAGP